MKQSIKLFFLLFLSGYALNAFSQSEYTYSNNWYVGSTEAGEWIRHKKVWLAAGNYRFTARAVASENGKTLALSLNENKLFSGIEVPADPSGKFHLVHLGSTTVTAGYYDIKVTFETGDVNIDMVFLKKDVRTDNTVLSTDIEYSLNHNDGMHISPIAGAAGSSSDLAKGGDENDGGVWYLNSNPSNGITYSRKQMQMWNKQRLYSFSKDYTQEPLDIRVQELAEAKVDFIWAHGRGEPDSSNEIQDRDFKTGAGGMPCRGLSTLVDAIQRNPYTKDKLKIAYFFDNAASFVSAGSNFGYSGQMDYGDPAFQNFMWEFAVKKWYQTIPKDMLFTIEDPSGQNRTIVPMQWWTSGIGTKWGSREGGLLFVKHDEDITDKYRIASFFQFLNQKMKDEFGYTVAWVLADNFYNNGGDPVKVLGWGIQGWFTWGKKDPYGKPIVTDLRTFNNKKFAFAFNGGRYPIQDRVDGTWDPDTDTGGYLTSEIETKARAAHVTALDENGIPRIREIYEQGSMENAKWCVLESWFDWAEGSTWYRSDHPEYSYPNQFMNLCREFADKDCGSILLESEGCDDFYDKSLGNKGGAYRLSWYKPSEMNKEYWDANLETDLDIFRPLHQLSPITVQYVNASTEKFTSISAGLRDVFALKSDGIYGNEIDGAPLEAWQKLTNSMTNAQKVVIGGQTAIALTTNNEVKRSTLSSQKHAHENNGWSGALNGNWSTTGGWSNRANPPAVEGVITVKDIDANNAMLWCVDNANNVYYRNFSATRPWVKVNGGQLTTIAVDENSGWGFSPEGKIKRFSLQSKGDWRTIENPHNLTKLSANCDEVWGVNANNEVYRINSSGYGEWQKVADGYKDVSVGTDFVWLLSTDGLPYKCNLISFADNSVFTNEIQTGLSEQIANTNGVRAYPIPFTDNLKIQVISDTEDNNATIYIQKIDGRTVYQTQTKIQIGITEMNLGDKLSNCTSGIYFLTVNKKSGKEVIKLVKQ